MQLHDIKRKNPNKKKRIVGRGGRHGKTSGRGTKGQNARAGRKKRPELRDIIKKLPKLRGYRFKSIETKPEVVNVSTLEKKFTAGAEVTPQALLALKLVKKANGKTPAVKILGTGELSKKLLIKGCLVSAGAKAIIEKAGGTIS